MWGAQNGTGEMRAGRFIAFKASFAVLAAIVTSVVAVYAMTDTVDSR